MLVTFNMSGFFAAVCQRFQFSLFISCFACLAWLSCLTFVSFNVEQRLQVLEATNVEIKEILAIKNDRLETLEVLVHKLKSSLIALNNKKDELDSDLVSSNLMSSNKETIWNHKIFRTCHEMHLADSSLTSGLHWIDPDGQGIGDNPIEVYCNMTTGTTSILHDSESPTKVKYCAGLECDSKSIKYFATKTQIAALENLSKECHQSIKYDCFNAPFEMNGVVYSWWNDRNGNPQYFWAGSNSSIHTCQCGISGKCAGSDNKCNCDAGLSMPESDNGVITNKFLLPVTRLNFDVTLAYSSSGAYTLGRFECSGQRESNGMPSSCEDLRRLGHSISGLYSVMGAKMIENIYCDFNKLTSEAGFEKRLGYVDVKSIPTYFYVQKTKTFNELDTPVPFEDEVINIGGAMDLTSGIFTAPRTGKYSFTFSGLARFTSTYRCRFGVDLVLNGKNVGLSWTEREKGSFIDYFTISLQSTLDLKAGDRVWLQIRETLNAFLKDNQNHHTHFSGQLLQEDISQLFN